MVLTPAWMWRRATTCGCLVKAAPATPYEFTVAMLAQNPLYHGSLSDRTVRHLLARERFGQAPHLSAGARAIIRSSFSYAQWTNPTTLSGSQFTVEAPLHYPFWIRFADDGTNRTVKVSARWGQFRAGVQLPRAGRCFCTADQVGVFANSWKTANGVPRIISFLHWRQS